MIRLAISVEGGTGEEFVKTVLLDHLRQMAIEIQPVLIGRARNADEGGGNVTIDRLTSEMASDSVAALRRIRAQFPTPEDINDDPSTALSKRIVGAIPRYRKSVHGPQVAETVGLGAIRAECSRFNEWVARLESLSN